MGYQSQRVPRAQGAKQGGYLGKRAGNLASFTCSRFGMGRLYNGKRVVTFHSNAKAPFHKLSNYHRAPIRLQPKHIPRVVRAHFPVWCKWLGASGKVFSSTEHAWHSLKASNKSTFVKFCQGGDFDAPDKTFFRKVLKKPDDAEKKASYWALKDNVGIAPNMIVKPANAKKFGLVEGDVSKSEEGIPVDVEYHFWRALLRQKYKQNPELKSLLLSTGDAYLLEFHRACKRLAQQSKPVDHPYAGLIDTDGTLYGTNSMGLLMADVRDELVSSEPEV